MIFDSGVLHPPAPDDLTFPQFFLDFDYSLRPKRKAGTPWLVDNDTGRSYLFGEAHARVKGLANALSFKYEIKENDVVCILSPNHIDYPIAIWAVHRLGGVVTSSNPALTTDEIVCQLITTEPTLIIANTDTEGIALAAARQVGIARDRIVCLSGSSSNGRTRSSVIVDDLIIEGNRQQESFVERKLQPGEAKTKLAFLSFSSGTTGKPKAVCLTHYSVVYSVLQIAQHHRIGDAKYDIPLEKRRFRPGDVTAVLIPLFHIYGLFINLAFSLYCGMTVVITPKFQFEEMLKSIVRYRITHLFLVPPQIVLLSKRHSVKQYDLSSIRYVVTGAAPTSPQLLTHLHKILPDAEMGQGYGMTETCATIALFPLSQRFGTPGSAGQMYPGMQGKVVKSDGTLGGYGDRGELLIRGPQVAQGYLGHPEATRETFNDGWVHTGDEVMIMENGDMFVVDRLKEIFKVRGFQVSPAELESHLLHHPDVSQAGVIGIPDDFSVEVPLAFITLNAEALARVERDPSEGQRIKDAIIKHVSDSKIHYKWLTGGVEFIEAIPTSPSGKVLHRVLRERARTLLASSESGPRGNGFNVS